MRFSCSRFFGVFSEILNRPLWVFVGCLLVGFISLIGEGSLLQLWRLHQSDKEMSRRIENLRKETENLSMRIKRASDPEFLELEASDYFDVVEKGDLIFVFSKEP